MRRRLVQNVLPWVTTAMSLVITLVVFLTARGSLERRSDDRLAGVAEDAAASFGAGLDRYADVLRAVDGLYVASANVTVGEFSDFVGSLDLAVRFSGAEAVMRVRRSTVNGPIAVETSAGVEIAPSGTVLDVVLGAPLAVLLDPTKDLQTTAMSAPFTWPVTTATAGTPPARHVVLAHHTAAHEWLLVWVDANEFVTGAGAVPAGYGIEVVDVTAGPEAPEPIGAIAGTDDPERTAAAEVSRFGRHWQVTVDHAGHLVSKTERDEPWILLAGGILLTAGLATTFEIQAAGRRQALALAEQASNSERVRLDLVETAPVAIVEVDELGLVRSWNTAASTLLGVTAADAIGRPLELPVSDEVKRAGLAAAFAGLGGHRLTLTTPAGERVATAFTRCDDVRHQVLILVDETTNVGLSRQLEQAQKLEVFGRLTGGIAHDFNNLLTPILGYIDMVLLRAQVGDADRGALQEARRAADRAAALVAKLLAVSRPPTGATAPIDVGRTIEELAGLLTTAAGGDVVRIDVRADDDDRPFARIDRTQLEQVVLNLLVNAHEAMDRPGHITITVSCDPQAVTIRVVDDGHGMNASTRAAMFEPFFSTKLERGGSGLGLATVYSITTAAGGSIDVDSETGRGTRIDVRLPRAHPEQATVPATTASSETTSAAGTVLLVEDDAAVRRLATTILRDHDFQVVPVASADDATDAFERLDETIDLLLTDVVLRGTSGTELAAQLRARRPDLRVLFMSGYTDGHFGAAGALPPGTRLLAKPFHVDDLLDHVRDALAEAS